MGDSFLLAIRRCQVLPKTNTVLCQPWVWTQRQEEREEQQQAGPVPEKFTCSQEQVLRRGLGGIARPLRLDPALSKVPGPLSTGVVTGISWITMPSHRVYPQLLEGHKAAPPGAKGSVPAQSSLSSRLSVKQRSVPGPCQILSEEENLYIKKIYFVLRKHLKNLFGQHSRNPLWQM